MSISYKNYKVGDIVKHYGFNFEPLKWWEKIIYSPRWYWNDFSYWIRGEFERIKYGFPLRESWNFHGFCSKWSLPRLKYLRKNLHGHPCNMMSEMDDQMATRQLFFGFVENVPVNKTAHEKWEEILDKIIWSMEHEDDDVEPIYPPNYDLRQRVIEITDRGVKFEPMDDRKSDWEPVWEHERRVQEGYELFGKHFLGLWD